MALDRMAIALMGLRYGRLPTALQGLIPVLVDFIIPFLKDMKDTLYYRIRNILDNNSYEDVPLRIMPKPEKRPKF